MARKLGLLMALALSVLAPAGVSSLGLGEIRLNSYLNEPLDAEVTISVSGPEELESLQVAVASEEAFERFGVDAEAFDKTWKSFEVDQKLRVAKDLGRRYSIQGVPAVVVNGKYHIPNTRDALNVLDELLVREGIN